MGNNLKNQHYKNMGITLQMDTLTFEAESCAFVVCEHFGLDTSDYSFGYVATWSANKELPELKASLQEIRNESAAMIHEIEEHLKEIELEQSLSTEADLTVEDTVSRLADDIAAFSYEYDPYGFADNVEEADQFSQEVESYLTEHNTDGLKNWLQSIVDEKEGFSQTAQTLINRIDALSSVQEADQEKDTNEKSEDTIEWGTISFYAAECAEFPDLGEHHENLSLEDALRLYEQIPADRMNAIKCIGFEIKDSVFHDGKFPMLQGDQIQTDIVNLVPFYREHPQVQQALTDLQKLMEERSQSKEKTLSLNCPIYPKTLKEARAAGEMDLYRNSYGATKLCAEEFSRSYEQAYSEHKVPEYLQKMVDQYGFKRCQIVLASTIQLLEKDGRISTAMKDAASRIQIPEASKDPNHDRRMDFRITCHPVTVNAAFRDLLKMEQKQMAASQTQSSDLSKMNAKESNVPQKKPSILKKLRDNQEAIASAGKKQPQVMHDKPHL